MKLSEKWLREWVNPKLSREALTAQLTMAGLAVESCEPVDDDYVIEFELTPNRGDCLSMLGTAREVAAINNLPFQLPQHLTQATNIPASSLIKNEIAVAVENPTDCPRYLCRVIKGIHPNIKTPEWMGDRLSKSGINSICPVVNVMNYVMLELGQPLHAFDLTKLENKISIRRANKNEAITLIDGKTVNLQEDVLVIADSKKVHAIAGIMGGNDSAVTELTTSILIESAHFTPEVVAGRARCFGLTTDASHRFERGVDPELPRQALEKATQYLSEIFGDVLSISDITDKTSTAHLPQAKRIHLRSKRVANLLGINISTSEINQLLSQVHMQVSEQKEDFTVIPPSYRFDIAAEEDLIEEVARLHGYQRIPAQHKLQPLVLHSNVENNIPISRLKTLLIDQGFQEVITYSFIPEIQQQQFDPANKALALANPLSEDLAVMRTNLWPGLMQCVQYNLNRQLEFLRFFEVGLRFISMPQGLSQEQVLSGVWCGQAYAEQWGEKQRPVDFFDVKNVLMQLLALSRAVDFVWQADNHPALHPAQSAVILKDNQVIGWCGALHPELQRKLEVKSQVFLFEIKLEAITHATLPRFQILSKFPTIRRDLAMVIDQSTTIEQLQQCIVSIADKRLIDFTVFDVYQGKNIPQGKKSIAVGLVFQALDRTLIEEDISPLMQNIITALQEKFAATLRE